MYRNKDILTKIRIMFDINFLRLTYIFQTPITQISIIHSLKVQLLAQVMTLNTDEKSFVHISRDEETVPFTISVIDPCGNSQDNSLTGPTLQDF